MVVVPCGVGGGAGEGAGQRAESLAEGAPSALCSLRLRLVRESDIFSDMEQIYLERMWWESQVKCLLVCRS